MKKHTISAFIILIIALLFSCGKDNANNTDDNGSIDTSTVKDTDGNVYKTVKICDQTWITSNLNVSHYRNGDEIPQVTSPAHFLSLKSGAWCYYNNNSGNGNTYGKLYNWYALKDYRGITPAGWHIPSSVEWSNLFDCLSGLDAAGGINVPFFA